MRVRETDGQTDRQTDRQTERQTDTGREGERGRGRRWTEGERDREIGRETETDRERQTERDRDGGRRGKDGGRVSDTVIDGKQQHAHTLHPIVNEEMTGPFNLRVSMGDSSLNKRCAASRGD